MPSPLRGSLPSRPQSGLNGHLAKVLRATRRPTQFSVGCARANLKPPTFSMPLQTPLQDPSRSSRRLTQTPNPLELQDNLKPSSHTLSLRHNPKPQTPNTFHTTQPLGHFTSHQTPNLLNPLALLDRHVLPTPGNNLPYPSHPFASPNYPTPSIQVPNPNLSHSVLWALTCGSAGHSVWPGPHMESGEGGGREGRGGPGKKTKIAPPTL